MTQKEQEREEKGIKAIIFLQGMADITETREQATAGWRSMSLSEQETTLSVYALMCKGAN